MTHRLARGRQGTGVEQDLLGLARRWSGRVRLDQRDGLGQGSTVAVEQRPGQDRVARFPRRFGPRLSSDFGTSEPRARTTEHAPGGPPSMHRCVPGTEHGGHARPRAGSRSRCGRDDAADDHHDDVAAPASRLRSSVTSSGHQRLVAGGLGRDADDVDVVVDRVLSARLRPGVWNSGPTSTSNPRSANDGGDHLHAPRSWPSWPILATRIRGSAALGVGEGGDLGLRPGRELGIAPGSSDSEYEPAYTPPSPYWSAAWYAAEGGLHGVRHLADGGSGPGPPRRRPPAGCRAPSRLPFRFRALPAAKSPSGCSKACSCRPRSRRAIPADAGRAGAIWASRTAVLSMSRTSTSSASSDSGYLLTPTITSRPLVDPGLTPRWRPPPRSGAWA